MKPLRAVIFDLDGTLIDSSEGIVEAVNYSLRQMGEPEQPPDRIKPFIGFPLSEMYPSFTEAPVDDLYRHFQVKAAETIVSSAVVMTGVEPMLQRLASFDIKMAIASTKIRRHIDGIVAKFGWQRYFKVVAGGNEVAQMKPAPDVFNLALERLVCDPEDAIVVGDTLNDILAARAVPMEVAGIVSPYDSEAFATHQPDFVLNAIDELPLLLRERLISRTDKG